MCTSCTRFIINILFPISIAIVGLPLHSAYLCVSVCVLVCFSLCVVIIVFFSDCRVYLFSSLAARVLVNLLVTRTLFVTGGVTKLVNIRIRRMYDLTRVLHALHISCLTAGCQCDLDLQPFDLKTIVSELCVTFHR